MEIASSKRYPTSSAQIYSVCHRKHRIFIQAILAVRAWVGATVLLTIHCQWLQNSRSFSFCGCHLERVSAQLKRQQHVLCEIRYGAAGAAWERMCGRLYSFSESPHIMLAAPFSDVVLLV